MSASARNAPARDVRRKYKRAVCIPDPIYQGFIVLEYRRIYPRIAIGRGATRAAAWNSAANRIGSERA